jgi:hypothetical protein
MEVDAFAARYQKDAGFKGQHVWDIRPLSMQSFRFACARRRIEKTGKRASVVTVVSPASF